MQFRSFRVFRECLLSTCAHHLAFLLWFVTACLFVSPIQYIFSIWSLVRVLSTLLTEGTSSTAVLKIKADESGGSMTSNFPNEKI